MQFLRQRHKELAGPAGVGRGHGEHGHPHPRARRIFHQQRHPQGAQALASHRLRHMRGEEALFGGPAHHGGGRLADDGPIRRVGPEFARQFLLDATHLTVEEGGEGRAQFGQFRRDGEVHALILPYREAAAASAAEPPRRDDRSSRMSELEACSETAAAGMPSCSPQAFTRLLNGPGVMASGTSSVWSSAAPEDSLGAVGVGGRQRHHRGVAPPGDPEPLQMPRKLRLRRVSRPGITRTMRVRESALRSGDPALRARRRGRRHRRPADRHDPRSCPAGSVCPRAYPVRPDTAKGSGARVSGATTTSRAP